MPDSGSACAPTTIDKPKINNEITAPELRVLDEKGENLGVMNRDEALALAQERETDLIEVVAGAKPPVARLINFDKYRYQKEKAEKKERQQQKTAGLKQIQISPRAAKNDLLIRVRQLEEFFKEDHTVEIQLRLRGRERYNKDWARLKLQEFLTMIPVEYRMVSPPKFGGRGMLVQIMKKK